MKVVIDGPGVGFPKMGPIKPSRAMRISLEPDEIIFVYWMAVQVLESLGDKAQLSQMGVLADAVESKLADRLKFHECP